MTLKKAEQCGPLVNLGKSFLRENAALKQKYTSVVIDLYMLGIYPLYFTFIPIRKFP